MHKSAGADDKKLQTSLKKLNVQPIQAIEEVDPSGAGSGKANTQPSGELRVSAGHEGGRLLMTDVYEPDFVLGLAERLHPRSTGLVIEFLILKLVRGLFDPVIVEQPAMARQGGDARHLEADRSCGRVERARARDR